MINTLDDIISAVETVSSSIPQISDTTNFWMVRSKQGVFYNEYVAGGYIAIGWNPLTEAVLSGSHDDDYYKQILKDSNYPDKMPGTALNKCRRFIEEIKSGDIAMIVGRSEIAFATIGDYFEVDLDTATAEKELEIHTQIETGTYLGLNCPYKKRRHISIISKVDLSSAPPMVYKCLVSNHHSLSSLNEYADATGTNMRKLYLSAILDLCDRRIVSFVIRDTNDAALVHRTLAQALEGNPGARPLLHSDRGSAYTTQIFHDKLAAAGITQSMSRVGKCIDNGPMEGFWGILKRERYYGRRFTSREQLVKMIQEYITYYNFHRLQRGLGVRTPMEVHDRLLAA